MVGVCATPPAKEDGATMEVQMGTGGTRPRSHCFGDLGLTGSKSFVGF